MNTSTATKIHLTNTEALAAYEFASTEKLQLAYLAGYLTERQVRGLLCFKAFTYEQVGALVKDWKSTKRFLAEESK